MKDITTFIVESSNKDAMFMGLTSRRTDDDFTFNVGEKCILLKYDTHGYAIQVRSLVEIVKVLKNNIVVKYANEEYAKDDTFMKTLKFDKKGIFVKKDKNKYLGNSTAYWVLYNKELADDQDIKELIAGKGSMWGFHSLDDKQIKDLKKQIKEITK